MPKRSVDNAFSVLMTAASQKKRPRRKSGSRFVLCPVGCGEHIPEPLVNRHIDQCLLSTQTRKKKATGLTSGTFVASMQSLTNEESKLSVATTTPEKSESTEHVNLQDSASSSVVVSEEKKPFDILSNTHVMTPSEKGDLDTDTLVSRNHREDEDNTVVEPAGYSTEKARLTGMDIDTGVTSLDSQRPEGDSCSRVLCEQSSPEPFHRKPESVDKHVESTKKAEPHASDSRTTEQHDLSFPFPKAAATETARDAAAEDAFSRMMSQSRTVFAKKEKQVFKQCLHLNENGSISLFFNQQSPADSRVAWSATVTVKDKSMDVPSEFLVTLSSSISSSSNAPCKLVRKHSRLSVPVLKSILQKSIRRRRPLPAVRVAMELAEKSLGDLLRRLPVIVLEDSTLHPDYSLLVWLMMAHSKDFEVSQSLMIRIFEIIFEVASCQWLDSCEKKATFAVKSPKTDESKSEGPYCTLTSLASNASIGMPARLGEAELAWLWSMLARAEYGGMRCDVDMLREYANVWKCRLCQSSLESVSKGAVCTKGDPDVSKWSDLPVHIHRRARIQAKSKVQPLVQNGLDRLHLEDICIEGVDFHCSNVVDALLADKPFCELCLDLLKLEGQDHGVGTIPSIPNEARSWLGSMLKQCMWTYCSGVNRRLPLETASLTTETETSFREIWKELAAPRVSAFQKEYVVKRLV